MKKPEECEDMSEIRQEIDQIDQQVIQLLGQRFGYVKAASKFKTSEIGVKAPDRLQRMLLERRIWAETAGLNPDIIEKMYKDLVNYFIEEETRQWKSQHGK